MFTRNESFQTFVEKYPIITLICFFQLILWILFSLPFPIFTLYFGFLSGYNGGIDAGEWWRLLTPVFLHASFSHLLFNSLALILFAPPLERMLKGLKFTTFYFTTGILANVATYIIEPPFYIHVGASGAIYGLFGLYVFIAMKRPYYMDKQSTQLILTIIGIGLIMTFLSPNTNVVAHLAGLMAGFLLGPLFLKAHNN